MWTHGTMLKQRHWGIHNRTRFPSTGQRCVTDTLSEIENETLVDTLTYGSKGNGRDTA